MSTWEERLGERARARREAQDVADRATAQAEYEAWLVEQRAAFLEREPEPPNGCHECWEARPHPSFGSWHWWHVWPESQPFEDWICHHECHGPGGEEQHAIAFG